MNSRTDRDFHVPTDIRQRVEKWAGTEGFRLLDGDVHFEAWIHA